MSYPEDYCYGSRDARMLSVEDMRSLMSYSKCIPETWNEMDTQATLDMWWAARDGDPGHWDGWQVFWEEDNEKARKALKKIEAAWKRRVAQANKKGNKS